MTIQEKRERAIEGLTALSDSIRRRVEDADDAYGCVSINLKYWQTIEDAISLLKAQEQDAQRDYEAAVEMAEYCERYEPTYNPEDGSM